MLKTKYISVITLMMLSMLYISCRKDRPFSADVLVPGPDLNFYALTSDNKLIYANAKNPVDVLAEFAITGLQTGENILGIDFRPATGQLYAVGSSSRLYIINPQNGVAKAVGTTPFSPAINGTAAGFDFNPTVDRIRLVTSAGQNLRLHPETGAVAVQDGAINGVANAKIGSVAYTQNRAGAATTVLYDIDVVNDKLHKQDPPNNGTLVEVGSLGYDVDEVGGFDINPSGSVALAAMSKNGKSALFLIDVTTGKASKINDLSRQIVGLAIPTEPVAYGVSTSNELLIFNPSLSTPVMVAKEIRGIQTGESIVGIDMRPLNGQLFALGSTGRLYSLNASSGDATLVGTGPMSVTLAGTHFGFDFNPTVDRIRIVSNTGQNLRVNPADATVTTDLPITLLTAGISGAAYTNNFSGATSTILYDIDATGDRLYRQEPPNNGVLVDVGPLGVNVEASNGFDIGSTSGIAYGIFTVGTVQRIYSVNLATGAATAGAVMATPMRGFTLGLGF